MADPLITPSLPSTSPPQPSHHPSLPPHHHSFAAGNANAYASVAVEEADVSEADERVKEADVNCHPDAEVTVEIGDADAAQVDERVKEADIAADNGGVDAAEAYVSAENVDGDTAVAEEEKGEAAANIDVAEWKEMEEMSESDRGKERKMNYVRFPVRPSAEDCGFYMRTGMCKFGMNCKFNHPLLVKGREESTDVATEKGKERDSSVDREARVDCKGEKECPYYMRNGLCKFGASCRYNHPDPTSVERPDALPGYRNGVGSILLPDASQSTLAPWSPPAHLNESIAYSPMVFPPTQCVPPQSEWNGYQAPLYPSEGSLKVRPTYAINSLSSERNIYAHPQEQILVDEFPERPGQPECAYFLRTGNCKYRSACKYHHPKKNTSNSPLYLLSDLGLPLRPGVSVCSYYSRYGICNYGPACKYDHPVNYTHPVVFSSVDLTHGLRNGMVNNHAMAASS